MSKTIRFLGGIWLVLTAALLHVEQHFYVAIVIEVAALGVLGQLLKEILL
jgi:hypothetical protein